jgi:Fur family transcriptional regulator, ferric uptake regulator
MAADTNNTNALLALQKTGISKTSQRLAVLNILLNTTTPLSVNTIRQSLKSKASIDKVTIYRILSLFRQHGIIREIASSGGVSFFEMVTSENPAHPHFSCRNCGAFTCMDPIPFTDVQASILSRSNYSIENVEINISGICSECRAIAKPEPKKQYHDHGEKLCIQKR